MGGRRRRSGGSDYTSDDEFQLGGSEDFDESSDDDDDEEDSDSLSEVEASMGTNSSSSEMDVDDDDSEGEEDDDYVAQNLKRKVHRRIDSAVPVPRKPRSMRCKKPPEVSDDEDSEEESDEDFFPHEEESEEPVNVTICKRFARGKDSGGRRGQRRNSEIVELVEEDGMEEKKSKKRSKRGAQTKNKKNGRKKMVSKDRDVGKRRRKRKSVSSRTTQRRGRRRVVITSSNEDDLDLICRREVIASDEEDDDHDFVVGEAFGVACKRKRRSRHFLASDFGNIELDHELSFLPILNANCKKKRSKSASEKGRPVEESGKKTCVICLSDERWGMVRGVLDSCAHFFCFSCIFEWSKVESRCPTCKQRFSTISKSMLSKTNLGPKPVDIKVPKRDQVYQPTEEELWGFLNAYDNAVCMECQQDGDDHLMLLCDLCDAPAHTYCVGLGRQVPEGDWYCRVCSSVEGQISENDPFLLQHNQDRVASAGAVPRESANRPAPLHVNSEQYIHGGRFWSPIPLAATNIIARASGPSSLTLSGRRALTQRIQSLFSSSVNGVISVSSQGPGTNISQFGYPEGDAVDFGHGDLNTENDQQQRNLPCSSYEEQNL